MCDDEGEEPGADGNEKEEEDNEKDEVEREENEQKNRFPEEEISFFKKSLMKWICKQFLSKQSPGWKSQ